MTFRTTNFKKIDKKWHRQVVKFKSSEPQGTVVVDTRNHFLYLIMENKTAIRYGVGVGKEGFKWFGRATIDRKTLWPNWTPPPEMRKRHPELPEFVDGGSPKNPLGPRAMYLHRDGVDTGYRFHGTIAAVEHRHGRVERLHPHVQRGCHRPLPALPDRHRRAGPAAYRRTGRTRRSGQARQSVE